MKDIITELNEFVENISRNESIASLLRKKEKKKTQEQRVPKNYYYVTHLSTPPQAYWLRTRPDIEKSVTLARRLAFGKKLQLLANFWFRTLPDFVVDEGKV